MADRTFAAQLQPKVPANTLSAALADFDRISTQDDADDCDFLTGDEHPELAPDESGW